MTRALHVIVAVLLVAGCGRRTDNGAKPPVVRISQRNEPADLDPATASLPDEFFIIRALSEGLLTPDPHGGRPRPAAAERYEVSADGLTYTFHLRADARWSNGEPVTADDFVASFRRVLTPETAAPKAHLFYAVRNARAFVLGMLTDFTQVGLRAPDPVTVVITLAAPNENFPRYVATGPWIPVNPRVVARYGRAWTDPAHYVGNGPFMLSEWRPQQRISVRRNPHYHDAGHTRVGAIQFVRFDDQESEERAFRAGQIDVTMAVPQTKLEVYAREHPDELHRAPLAETRFIVFNLNRAPLTDERVRRALALAIDREKLVTRVLRGGQQPASRFLSPALAGPAANPADSERIRQGYNPDSARRLLAAAGFAGGRGFPSLEFAGWDRNPVLDAIQEMWQRNLGIRVRLVVREAKVHLATISRGDYDLAFVTNLPDVQDPAAALADFTTGAPNNFPRWHSTEFDRLVAMAEITRDAHAADDDLRAAEALLVGGAVVAPLYFNTQNWLMSPRVDGWAQDAFWSRRYNDLRLED